jgi:NodT family efflux transporter outer membrane factor (OMF) lipoprotein
MKRSLLRLVPLTAACVGVLAAAGCATDIRGPALAVSSRYGEAIVEDDARNERMRSAASAAHVEIAADPWWRAFGDPGLDRLVDDVLARNRDLHAAALRLQRARLQIGLARSDRLPAADGSATVSDSEPMRDHGDSQTTANAQLSVAYEVDLWGRLRTAQTAAAWAERASAEDVRSVALSLVANACDLYWQLGDVNARLSQGEIAIDNARRTRALIDAQYRAGAVSGLETAEAEQSLQQQIVSQSRLLQQRSELRNAIAALRDGLAWPETQEPQSADAKGLPLDPGLPAELLGRRPDLRAAEWRLRQTLADSDAARLDAYPRLNLTLGASGDGTSLADLVDRPVRTLTRSLLLPFLDINGTRLRIAVARKDYEIAEEDFHQTLVVALGEVETALAAREPLQQQTLSAQRTLDAARAVEVRYEARYRAGAVPLRRWLDAQQSRISAESALSQAQLALRRNDIVLAKALGGSARMPPTADAAHAASSESR